MIHHLSTSYRELEPHKTLDNALQFAKQLGIVRVAEVTWLDRIGIPVFVSIRPNASTNSLCVHAGKGLQTVEAYVSALMEGIEFAVAENPRSSITVFEESPKYILGTNYSEILLSFCPIFGRPIPVHSKLRWMMMEDMLSGTIFPVPADLVLYPLPNEPTYLSYFGSSTNGLASGNSITEATVHAVLEVMERHIESFRLVKDKSAIVDSQSLPETIRKISFRMKENGLNLVCKYLENEFQIPYFSAFIFESTPSDPIFASEGFGCHPNPFTSLTRAVTEAAQSRLSFIHGGRDDIIDRYKLFKNDWPDSETHFNQKLRQQVLSGETIEFNSICPLKINEQSVEKVLEGLLKVLVDCGYTKVGRQVLTDSNDPVTVVRIVVPGLEALNSVTKRIGPNLAHYVKHSLT